MRSFFLSVLHASTAEQAILLERGLTNPAQQNSAHERRLFVEAI